MSDIENISSMWGPYAGSYQRLIEPISNVVYELLGAHMDLETLSEGTILFTGCGTGNGPEIFRKKLPETVKFVGNDCAELMLVKANEKNVPNTEFILADNESLPYPDNYFDRYFANLSLHITGRPPVMLKEAFRLLKPGQKASFSVPTAGDESDFINVMYKGVNDAGVERVRRLPFILSDYDALRDLIIENGFVDVRGYKTSLAYHIKDGPDAADKCKQVPFLIEYKAKDEELYKRILQNIAVEADRVLNLGKMLVFNLMLYVVTKPHQ